MKVFCAKCGTSALEGTKFCEKCGNPFPAAQVLASPPAGEQETEKKKGGGGFFSTPAGIALVAIIGLAVIAGITFGVILLVRSGANNSVDAATMDVWDEYESILENDSADVAQINMDPNALTKTQEDLKKTQERVTALEKVLAKTGGTEQKRTNNSRRPTNTRDIKAEQAAEAAAAEAERQRQAAQAQQEAAQSRKGTPRVANPCGNPDCSICYYQ